ncbi:MAG: hypothetical protein JOZ19_11325 [Rubrobacter sp.]|nr:hypothetical protein [Rubrobacter sp.]
MSLYVKLLRFSKSRSGGIKPLWSRIKLLKALVTVLLALAAALLGAWLYGAYRWNAGTQQLRARLDSARMAVRPRIVDFSELEGLPAPVQRYFRVVLKEGQPMVAQIRVQHIGTFNMGETTDLWKPFTSDQEVVAQRPGFDWDGRVAMMPGVPVRVHDAYVAGEGMLHASLLGLFSLVDMHGGDDVAEGELMRFFAEAAWYPTALLPSQGVRWQTVDDRSAYATLTEDTISVTMLFTFDEQGLIETVGTEARGRMVDSEVVPTPWQGRFWNYNERGGMQVPLDGEVAWLLPEGAKPYWRGRITDIDYEFAQ